MTIEYGSYGFGRRVAYPYDEAVEKTKSALKTVGFGVLTEIDVKKTMKEKLNVDFRRYTILGACNPPLAHKALTTDFDIGLLLPCNVVVYEEGEGSVVRIMDPQAVLGIAKIDSLAPLATDVRSRLEQALSTLG